MIYAINFTQEEQNQIIIISILVILLILVVCGLVGLWLWWLNRKFERMGLRANGYLLKKGEDYKKKRKLRKEENDENNCSEVPKDGEE